MFAKTKSILTNSSRYLKKEQTQQDTMHIVVALFLGGGKQGILVFWSSDGIWLAAKEMCHPSSATASAALPLLRCRCLRPCRAAAAANAVLLPSCCRCRQASHQPRAAAALLLPLLLPMSPLATTLAFGAIIIVVAVMLLFPLPLPLLLLVDC